MLGKAIETLLVRNVELDRSQIETTHFLKGTGKSTIAFSLKVKELGIAAPEFKELLVSPLLSNLTTI